MESNNANQLFVQKYVGMNLKRKEQLELLGKKPKKQKETKRMK